MSVKYFLNDRLAVIQGDCAKALEKVPENSIDAIVTDPPYGLSKTPDMAEVLRHWLAGDDYEHTGNGFMGKTWDSFVPGPATWRALLRVLKPGGHVVSFFGSRTYDMGVLAMRLAGFEIRDSLVWLYASGMPKSYDIAKGVARHRGGPTRAVEAMAYMKARRMEMGLSRSDFEKRVLGYVKGNVRNWEEGISFPRGALWLQIKSAMGVESTPYDADMERGDEVVEEREGSYGYQKSGERWDGVHQVREPATDLSKKWKGFGTGLKPAQEPIVLARKPLVKNVVTNVLSYGTGGLNIDECRVPYQEGVVSPSASRRITAARTGWDNRGGTIMKDGTLPESYRTVRAGELVGYWPANLLLSHDPDCASDGCVPGCPVDVLDEQGGVIKTGGMTAGAQRLGMAEGYNGKLGALMATRDYPKRVLTASNFFYCSKASNRERIAIVACKCGQRVLFRSEIDETCATCKSDFEVEVHPTVKPLKLMRWLVRLVTPPGGVVLDPFSGTGTTLVAAIQSGFHAIGVEESPKYVQMIEGRVTRADVMEVHDAEESLDDSGEDRTGTDG